MSSRPNRRTTYGRGKKGRKRVRGRRSLALLDGDGAGERGKPVDLGRRKVAYHAFGLSARRHPGRRRAGGKPRRAAPGGVERRRAAPRPVSGAWIGRGGPRSPPWVRPRWLGRGRGARGVCVCPDARRGRRRDRAGRTGALGVIRPIVPVEWRGEAVLVLDQRRLPHEESVLECRTVQDVCEAIRTLAVRGAPVLGIAAAYALSLAAATSRAPSLGALETELERAGRRLRDTRP